MLFATKEGYRTTHCPKCLKEGMPVWCRDRFVCVYCGFVIDARIVKDLCQALGDLKIAAVVHECEISVAFVKQHSDESVQMIIALISMVEELLSGHRRGNFSVSDLMNMKRFSVRMKKELH